MSGPLIAFPLRIRDRHMAKKERPRETMKSRRIATTLSRNNCFKGLRSKTNEEVTVALSIEHYTVLAQ